MWFFVVAALSYQVSFPPLHAPVQGNDSMYRDGEFVRLHRNMLMNSRNTYEVTISAERATYIEVKLKDVRLGGGAVEVYSEDRLQKHGPFTQSHVNVQHGTMLLPMIVGSTAILRIVHSEQRLKASPSLVLDGIIQGYAHDDDGIPWSTGVASNCLRNALCDSSTAALRDSIVNVHVGGGWCTGTLAKGSSNGDVYLWSAHHCGTDTSSYIVYLYNTLLCSEWDPANGIGHGTSASNYVQTFKVLSNLDLIATNAVSDVSLFKFHIHPLEDPVANLFHIVTAPWSASLEVLPGQAAGNQPTFCLSHPGLQPLSIVRHAAGVEYLRSDYRYRVTATDSATQGGSSGSGLFTTSGVLVGTLYGGTSSCDNLMYGGSQWDIYGSLNSSWALDSAFRTIGVNSAPRMSLGCKDPLSCSYVPDAEEHDPRACKEVDHCGVCGGNDRCVDRVFTNCSSVLSYYESLNCCTIHSEYCRGLQYFYQENTCCDGGETLLSTNVLEKSPSPPPLPPPPSPPPLTFEVCTDYFTNVDPLPTCNSYGIFLTRICTGSTSYNGKPVWEISLTNGGTEHVPVSDTWNDQGFLWDRIFTANGALVTGMTVISPSPVFTSSSSYIVYPWWTVPPGQTLTFQLEFTSTVSFYDILSFHYIVDPDADVALDCATANNNVYTVTHMVPPSPPVFPPNPPGPPPPTGPRVKQAAFTLPPVRDQGGDLLSLSFPEFTVMANETLVTAIASWPCCPQWGSDAMEFMVVLREDGTYNLFPTGVSTHGFVSGTLNGTLLSWCLGVWCSQTPNDLAPPTVPVATRSFYGTDQGGDSMTLRFPSFASSIGKRVFAELFWTNYETTWAKVYLHLRVSSGPQMFYMGFSPGGIVADDVIVHIENHIFDTTIVWYGLWVSSYNITDLWNS